MCLPHKRGWGFWTLDDQSLKPSPSSSSLNPSGHNPSGSNPSIISSNPKPSFRFLLYHPFKPSIGRCQSILVIYLVNGTSHQASLITKLYRRIRLLKLLKLHCILTFSDTWRWRIEDSSGPTALAAPRPWCKPRYVSYWRYLTTSNHEKRPAQASHAPLSVCSTSLLSVPCLLCDFGCRSTHSSFCIRLDV